MIFAVIGPIVIPACPILLADPNGLAGRQTAFALNSLGSSEPGVREANAHVFSSSKVTCRPQADDRWHWTKMGKMRGVRLF